MLAQDSCSTPNQLEAECKAMRGTLPVLRVLRWALLGSIVLYVAVEFFGGSFGLRPRAVDPSLSYIFTTAGVGIVGVIFVVRRTLVLRSAEALAAHPGDALILNHWKSGYFATYALCEMLALVGLVLRFLGS